MAFQRHAEWKKFIESTCQLAKSKFWHANLRYNWHAILIDVAKLHVKWQHCVPMCIFL
jgi:hypothetical protein